MVDVDFVSVGKRVDALMKRRNLSDRDLEKLSGVGKSAINSIRKGKTKDPSLLTMLRLCNALEVPLGYLINMDISGTEQEKNNQNQANARDYTGLSESTIEELHKLKKYGTWMDAEIYELAQDSSGIWYRAPRRDIHFLDEFFVDSGFFSGVNDCLLSMAEGAAKLRERKQRKIGVFDTEVWGAVHSMHRLVESLCDRFLKRYLHGEGVYSDTLAEDFLPSCLGEELLGIYGYDPQENE